MPRRSSPILLIAMTMMIGVLGCRSAVAQTQFHPDATSPMKPNPYLRHADPWRWDLRSQLLLQPGIYYRNNSGTRQEITAWWDLPDFEFIFPVVREGSFYWSPNEDVITHLRIDGINYTPEPEVLQTPESHAKYVWWRSNQRDRRTNQLYFSQVSHIVSADTIFDEQRAKEIPWPDAWPEEAGLFLTPVVDRVRKPIDPIGQDRIAELVKQWTQGKDPKSIDQVTLTKFLTGKVLEFVRVERGRSELAPTIAASVLRPIISGFSVYPLTSWSGFKVRSADRIAVDPSKASILDMSMMLTAVLRTAGIPARTIVCFDNYVETDQSERIIALVEFAMYDHERDQILWIPIDPERLRDNGRRSNVYEQRWDYFGTHDQLHDIVPVAYYFHPPVNYKAYGYPALYGLKTTPDIGNSVTQILSTDVINTPSRGDDFQKKQKNESD